MTQAEVLAAPERRRVGRGVKALLLVVGGLVIIGVVGDGALRRHETGRLLDRMATAQASLAYADRRVAGTVRYASPQLTSPQVPEGVRADLRSLVQAEAAGQLPGLESAMSRAAAVRIAPWHADQRRAREACLRLLRLQVGRFRAGAADLDALGRRPPEQERVRRGAVEALNRAAGPAQERRVSRVFGPA